jgi:biotin-(acetyl-CoA carboxylase) ligase
MESIIRSFLQHKSRIDSHKLVEDIERNLAYMGQEIVLIRDDEELARGNLQGITPRGGLRLQSPAGEELVFKIGEIQLGLVDR